jgi:hypothetical protein
VVKTIVTLESVELMKVFPQPNAPRMAHVPPRVEGNHASSTHCKKVKKIAKIQSSHSMVRRKSI